MSGVGKTSLVRRYTENKWNPAGTASTTGAFFVTHKTDFKGTRVKLQIWDTAGKNFIFGLPQSPLAVGAFFHLGAYLRTTSMAPLVLESPRPARLLAHRQAFTPSGVFQPSGQSIEFAKQIGASYAPCARLYRRTCHEGTLEAFPIVFLQAAIGIWSLGIVV